jgi:hypothetical protein
MSRPLRKGDRVRVTEKVLPGWGTPPKPGTLGTVESEREDGTLLVLLQDGRRALLAPFEVELAPS